MPRDLHDAPLKALLEPFTQARLSYRPGALFLNARYDAAFKDVQWRGLACQQSFKPAADVLERAGVRVVRTTEELGEGKWPLVLILPPRQRDYARALMAWAALHVEPGGRIVVAASNAEGARSSEADLTQIAGPVEVLSKHKCRVFWTPPLHICKGSAVISQWLQADAPRPIAEDRFISRPGVFAWDRIDAASELLASHLPTRVAGTAADLGAGFGYLSAQIVARCRGISQLDVYEAEYRALTLAERNLLGIATQARINYLWHDVLSGLPQTYDFIVTNPPFHAQRQSGRPDIGRRFLQVATDALRPGGELWLVANRHLPYEDVLRTSSSFVRTVAQGQGFKVLAARRSEQRT